MDILAARASARRLAARAVAVATRNHVEHREHRAGPDRT